RSQPGSRLDGTFLRARRGALRLWHSSVDAFPAGHFTPQGHRPAAIGPGSARRRAVPGAFRLPGNFRRKGRLRFHRRGRRRRDDRRGSRLSEGHSDPWRCRMTLPHELLLSYRAIDAELMGEIPPASTWLSAAELVELARLRDEARRRQWLAGRWIAKDLLRECLCLAHNVSNLEQLRAIEILSRDERQLGISPRVLMSGEAVACRLSISHDEQGAAVACSPSDELRLGIDLVGDVPR